MGQAAGPPEFNLEALWASIHEDLDRKLRDAAKFNEVLDLYDKLCEEGLSLSEIRQRLDEKFGPVSEGKEE